MGAGRPTELTPEVRKQFCRAIRCGITRTVAAQELGFTYGTIRNWVTKGNRGLSPYAEFVTELKKAEAGGERFLVQIIRKAARKSWQAAAWLLERSPKYSRRWVRKDLERQVARALDQSYPDRPEERTRVLEALLEAEKRKLSAS